MEEARITYPQNRDRWLVWNTVYRVDLLEKFPAAVTDMLDTVINIPSIIGNIVKTPHETLHKLNGFIDALKEKNSGHYDINMIANVLICLEVIVRHSEPEQIFYPQVLEEAERQLKVTQ